ncbi:MAG: type IV pilus assembly protein PilM [Candidatus Omnitrophota bacterium]|nr:type IV pilus assembly protein PilM [Candidatus Omnitrophota bacterium]
MFNPLRSKKLKANVGLNISSSGISVAEMAGKNEKYHLLHFGFEPLKDTKAKADLGDAIKKAMDNAGITSKEVNTSVAGQEVIVRYIEFPQMAKDELNSAIKFEAEKYIPFNIDDVVLDCQILDKGSQGKMKVLLVAAKKDLIDKHISLIEQAGLRATLIDVDSFAIINAFQANNPRQVTGTIALLNLGKELSSINILKGNTSCFTRDILIGGDNLNVENLLSEIHLSFDYYESQFEKGIDRVFLNGESSGLAGLRDSLKESLKLEIRPWNAVEGLEIDPGLDKEKLSAVSDKLTVAVGLALRKA